MKRRKTQVIPEPLPSCELEGAVIHEESRPHKCFVAFPAKPGPQPCIVQITEPGRPIFYWRVVILPSNAPWKRETKDSTVGTLLSLVSHCAEKQIMAAAEDEDTKLWSATGWDEPPFRTIDHTDYFKHAANLIKELKKADVKLPAKLQQLVSDFDADTKSRKKRWSPRVLPPPKDDDMRENFVIITRWPDWDEEGLTMTQRIPHIADICGKEQPRDIATFKELQVAIKKRLQFLRLKCPVRSKRGQRHVDIEQFLRETVG